MKSLLTTEFIENLAQLVAEGNTTKDACLIMGITEQAYYQWLEMAEGKRKASAGLRTLCVKLAESMRIAKAKNKDFHIQVINKAARGGIWQASAWYLERAYKDEYGRSEKHELTGKDGTPLMPQKVTFEIVDPQHGKSTDSESIPGSSDPGKV